MAIDINSEQILTVAEAARLLPGRPSTRTVWRWLDRGVRHVKLESVLVGGRRFVSKESINRFLESINQPDVQRTSPAVAAKRKRAIKRAEKELQEAGL